MPEMVEHGLAGEKVSRRATLLLKGTSILSFLLVWTLVSTVVAVYGLLNSIFLPSSWTVFRKILDIALARQLEVHIAATLQRVIIGFAMAAGLAVSLGILAGRSHWLRNLLEPVVEVFRPIPPLALLPLFIVWVGIARALANNPTVILMDEPFGSPDAQTREIMQEELSHIQRVEHKTIVFVTHSIREAVFLADRVLVMTSSPGQLKEIVEIALPEPRDKFSAAFTQYESAITRILKEEVEKVRYG
jgi:hypothetical protein